MAARYLIHVQAGGAPAGKAEAAALRRAARAVLVHEGAASPAELTLLVTTDERMRDFNRRFLGEDRPTDVLAFPSPPGLDEPGRRYLGDLCISLHRAVEQARSGGHPLTAELSLLVVHGVLHLLGHDHDQRARKARMWKAQGDILEGLGYPRLPGTARGVTIRRKA